MDDHRHSDLEITLERIETRQEELIMPSLERIEKRLTEHLEQHPHNPNGHRNPRPVDVALTTGKYGAIITLSYAILETISRLLGLN